MRDLYFFHDDNGAFTDYTRDARDYLRDEFAIDFTSIDDFVYIGLYKPFNKVYVELKTPALADVNLNAEYYDGAAWQSLTLEDDTKGLTRSGFISFEKPENWNSTAVNGEDKHYIRLSADTFTAEIQGLNLVFADDNDLRQEVRCIDDFLQGNDTTFIAYHVSARNDIVQTLRNGGNATKQENQVNYKNLTKWDLLETGEVRQAAKYLCLSKIFHDVSENIDDKQYQRAIDYAQKYGEAFKLFRLSLDNNDDGIADEEEKTVRRGIQVHKL
jgi:hypothetical protein